VVDERLRIARELHDVLSHSLATISLQSGAGLRLFRSRPDQAEAALRGIRQVSNDALAQARSALARIREPLEPAGAGAGLDDLDALLASVRAAGMAVTASVAVGDELLPAAVGPVAYRVVQESLTNVMRHAGPDAGATVRVARDGDAILVEIADTGGDAAPAAAQPGHGLVGMRERVLGAGGTFAAGPGPDGGFRVTARLPLEGARP